MVKQEKESSKESVKQEKKSSRQSVKHKKEPSRESRVGPSQEHTGGYAPAKEEARDGGSPDLSPEKLRRGVQFMEDWREAEAALNPAQEPVADTPPWLADRPDREARRARRGQRQGSGGAEVGQVQAENPTLLSLAQPSPTETVSATPANPDAAEPESPPGPPPGWRVGGDSSTPPPHPLEGLHVHNAPYSHLAIAHWPQEFNPAIPPPAVPKSRPSVFAAPPPPSPPRPPPLEDAVSNRWVPQGWSVG